MNRTEKEKLVTDLNSRLKKSQVAVIAGYKGIDVPGMSKLRKSCREANLDFMVVKNTLFKRAIKDTDFSAFDEMIDGPTSIAIAEEDPVTLSKTLVDFSKENKNLVVMGGIFRGSVIGAEKVIEVANLPSREVLLSMVASGLQAPYRGFVCALNGIISKFANVLSQIQKKKES